AVWRPELPHAGRYRVIAYVPYALSGLEESRRTQFRVRHADGEAAITIDARTYANDWVELGTYQFNAGQGAVVTLSNLTEDNQLCVWADAVMWIPAE
ncbi:MAG TPA: peptidase M23, partial [Roseiflexaceae bacterium]|nr:peptidase M23 [Roseiflexaceae bacterium]